MKGTVIVTDSIKKKTRRFSLRVFQGVLTFLFSFDIIPYRNGRSASDEDMYQRANLCTVSFFISDTSLQLLYPFREYGISYRDL